jgi:hypothetical protein
VHTAPYSRVVKGRALRRLSFSHASPRQRADDSGALMTPSQVPDSSQSKNSNPSLRLKKTPPYWYSYECKNAKSRWIGREIHEVMTTEFRAVPPEYHVRGLRFLYNSDVLYVRAVGRSLLYD